jgi:hypothetical protein
MITVDNKGNKYTLFLILVKSKTDGKINMNIYNKSYSCNRPWKPTGLWDVEAPTFALDNRLTEDGKVVSLTRRPPFTPQKDSWYSFRLEA